MLRVASSWYAVPRFHDERRRQYGDERQNHERRQRLHGPCSGVDLTGRVRPDQKRSEGSAEAPDVVGETGAEAAYLRWKQFRQVVREGTEEPEDGYAHAEDEVQGRGRRPVDAEGHDQRQRTHGVIQSEHATAPKVAGGGYGQQ